MKVIFLDIDGVLNVSLTRRLADEAIQILEKGIEFDTFGS